MKHTPKKVKRFYIGLFIPLILFALNTALSSLILLHSGEYMPIPQVVAKLEKTHGVFGSALYERTFWYKKELYMHFKPDVATLGSSRVLQFRKDQFNTSFANLGSMHNLDEIIEIAHNLFPKHKPKVLILGIDFWWFHPNAETVHTDRSPESVKLSANDLFQPIRWLAVNKMHVSDIGNIITDKTNDVGIAGITFQDGFDVYGSYSYTSTYTGEKKNKDAHFKENLGKIEAGDKAFAQSEKMSLSQWKKFDDLLIYLKAQNIKVILFLPPNAPTVNDAMDKEGDKYAFVKLLKRKLEPEAKKYGFDYYNFHDIRYIGSNDCEFADGVHGGPVAYDRILLNMAMKNADLRKVADLVHIGGNIQRYSGNTSFLGAKEVDFLKIGCKRTAK